MRNKKLLFSLTSENFTWEFFTAGGPGGQHRNRVATACRCKHEPSKEETAHKELYFSI